MKATLRELMDNLGIDAQFGPYDSQMWMADNDDKGQTCTAQASMDAEGVELEVTINLMHQNPPEGISSNEAIMYFHVKQDVNKKWVPDTCRIRKELYHAKIYDWQKKACDFFVAVTNALNRNDVPDIDELIERIFKPSDNYSAGTASGGSKKPMIRPEQLLDPTKRGF